MLKLRVLLTASLICLVAVPLTAGLAAAAKMKGKIRKDVYDPATRR